MANIGQRVCYQVKSFGRGDQYPNNAQWFDTFREAKTAARKEATTRPIKYADHVEVLRWNNYQKPHPDAGMIIPGSDEFMGSYDQESTGLTWNEP